jgi:DNA-binding IclR family transcriptional regulator
MKLKEGPPAFVSVGKAFRILELLAERSPRSVSEVARALSLTASSVSRMLQALADLGYARKGERVGQYRIGSRVLALSERYLQGDPLVREAGPVLRSLARRARASAQLAILVEGQALILAREPSPERIQVASRLGMQIPAHASALGKVLLAGLAEDARRGAVGRSLARFTPRTITDRAKLLRVLDEVRRRGYALESEEEHRGVGCIGAPVRDADGRWIAAVSITGPVRGTSFRMDPTHVKMALEKAAELSRAFAAREVAG